MVGTRRAFLKRPEIFRTLQTIQMFNSFSGPKKMKCSEILRNVHQDWIASHQYPIESHLT